MPATVALEVADGGAFVKDDTAGSALKPCTLENGKVCGDRAPDSCGHARWVIFETTALNSWIRSVHKDLAAISPIQLTLAHCTNPVDIPASSSGRSPSYIDGSSRA